MHPSHAVANIVDTLSTEGKLRSKHLNSDLDAPCVEPESFWAGLVPAGLRIWWQERAEKRHLKQSIARLDGLSPHLLSDVGLVGADDPAEIKRNQARKEKTRKARIFLAPIAQPTVTEVAPQADRVRELA